MIHRYLFYLGTAVLSWVLPKNHSLYVLDHTSGCENLRALKNYFNRHGLAYKEIGYHRDLLPNSWAAMVALARCKWLIVDFDTHYLGPRPVRFIYNIDYLDVWHATGLKYILYRSEMSSSKWAFLWYGWRRYVCASGEEDQKIKQDGYGPLARVIITGSPQADVLSKQASKNISHRIAKILYAPSFVDKNKDKADPEIFANLRAMEKVLQAIGAELVIKMHPLSKATIDLNAYRRITAWGERGATNEHLKEFDLLISDYSGVVCDFSLLGRPIVILLQQGANHRRLWYRLDQLFPSSCVQDFDGVTEKISHLALSKVAFKRSGAEAREASTVFHRWNDGLACQRIADFIMSEHSGRD